MRDAAKPQVEQAKEREDAGGVIAEDLTGVVRQETAGSHEDGKESYRSGAGFEDGFGHTFGFRYSGLVICAQRAEAALW
jgi:hypothetical protein